MNMVRAFLHCTLFVVLVPRSGDAQVTIVVRDHNYLGSALQVGIDLGDGSGFSYSAIPDEDNDGMIQLPRLPIGSRLALGFPQTGGGTPVTDPGCVIWDYAGDGIVNSPGSTIEYPLLASAATGATLGVDYAEIAAPPLVLTPGAEFSVTSGMLPGWPGIRLLDDSGVPGLSEFVAAVDALPAFNGDAVVSNVVIRFTFVPEPSAASLLVIGALGFGPLVACGPGRRRV